MVANIIIKVKNATKKLHFIFDYLLVSLKTKKTVLFEPGFLS